MSIGSGASVPRLAATIYGPVPVDSWVTAFGGRVGVRAAHAQALKIGAYTVDALGEPARWLGEAAFTVDQLLLAGSDSLWTPAKLSPAFWLDASAITGLSDNTAVASWTDRSGNGRHATNGTAGERPTYQTNEVNGLPVVRFDGSDDDLTITGHGLTKPCTIAIVTKIAGGNGANDRVFDATNMRMEIGGTGTNDFLMNGGSSLQYSTDTLNTAPHVHVLSFASSGNSRGAFDGTANTGNAGTGAAGANLVIGSSGAANHIAQDVCEIIGINGTISATDLLRLDAYLAHKWGIAANLPGSNPFKADAPTVDGATVELRQTVSDTGLANEGIPLPAGSMVAIYCFSTGEVAVSYTADGQSETLTRDDVTAVPLLFGVHERIEDRALDLYLETAPNNALPFVHATALRDDLSNGSHFLTPFFNPSGHDAVWGGEPAVNFSRFDLIDEQHGDELSRVHLQVSSAPDVGSLVWERELTKGEFYDILQPSGVEISFDLVATYIGPKLAPGTYYMRARFADYFGAWSDWTEWLDRGGARSKAVWIDRKAFYLAVSPGVSPVGRIDSQNPAALEAIYDAGSSLWATRAHVLISEMAEETVSRVVLSELVDVSAAPGQAISVPWDGAWDDLDGGQDYAYRLRAIVQGTWEPYDAPNMALWLDASSMIYTHEEADPVPEWADRRGDGPVLVQSSSGAQPSYQTDVLNSRPVVRFGGNDWLTIASTLGITANPFTVYAVWNPAGTGQAMMLWDNNTGLIITDFTDDVGIFSGSALFDFNKHPFGVPHVLVGTFNGVSSSLVAVDGQAETTGSAGSGVPSGLLTLGAGIDGIDRWLTGDIAELIIVRNAPSTNERRMYEGYLAHKYGLAANLPGGHPYKAAAPGAENGYWYVSNAPEWQRFRTNAPPTVPTGLTPDGAEGVGDYPLLVAISSDADDTPSTGFGVRFRITDPDDNSVTVNARLRVGTADTWEYQTGEDAIPETGAYTWDAQAFDAVETTDWSVEAEFVYGDLPIVAITEPDPGDIASGATVTVEWTTSATQTAYRVRLFDDETEELAYDSGLTASASLNHLVPTDELAHDRDYRVLVNSTDTVDLVGSDDVVFHVRFALPDAPSNFQANPLALAGDIEPTVVELTWDSELWTPAALGAALAFWHKADAITGQADNTAVASWSDSSGNGRHAANATGSEQPTYQTNEINGMPVVRSDGSDDDLTVTGHGLTKPCTIAWIGKIAGGNGSGDRIFHSSNMYNSITGTADFIQNGGSNHQYSNDTLDTAAHVHVLVYNGASSVGSFDGTAATGDAGNSAPSANIVFFSTGTASHIAMDLGEIVAIQGALSEAERQRVEGYLAHKWGLAASLPGDHPYKILPPFIAYRVTRQAAIEGDDGIDEITLATITDPEETTFIDRFPASDIPYTYRLYQIGERGASEVASLPASDTAEIELTTVVLTGVGFGTSQRVALRYVEGNDIDQTTDEAFLVPWGDEAPISFEGTTNYRTINATFALVTDATEDAIDGLIVLRRMTRGKPRPIICYRDDRGRKLFGTMKMREQDREIAWYGVNLVITETNYAEGSD